MKPILAIDGGGTSTRCYLLDEEGSVLSTGFGGPSNHLLVPIGTVSASLTDAIGKALSAARKEAKEIECVSAGLAGVGHDGTGSKEMHELFSEISFTNVLIEGDMVIAHAGALVGKPGVLALAGTGSSVLGIGPDGKRVKIGGWGPVFGDEGGGYRIGQSALRAAARDFDGRGPRTNLTAALTEQLGVKDFSESIGAVYLKGILPREIARLSETVCKAAQNGDTVATEILECAGAELAESVAAAIHKLGSSAEPPRVSYQGSVITSCSTVQKAFAKALADIFPDAGVFPPQFPPVIGAYLIARRNLGLADSDSTFSTIKRALRELGQ